MLTTFDNCFNLIVSDEMFGLHQNGYFSSCGGNKIAVIFHIYSIHPLFVETFSLDKNKGPTTTFTIPSAQLKVRLKIPFGKTITLI